MGGGGGGGGGGAAHAKNDFCKGVFFNPFMPSGLFYLNSLDRFISYIGGVWLVVIITMFDRSF